MTLNQRSRSKRNPDMLYSWHFWILNFSLHIININKSFIKCPPVHKFLDFEDSRWKVQVKVYLDVNFLSRGNNFYFTWPINVGPMLFCFWTEGILEEEVSRLKVEGKCQVHTECIRHFHYHTCMRVSNVFSCVSLWVIRL